MHLSWIVFLLSFLPACGFCFSGPGATLTVNISDCRNPGALPYTVDSVFLLHERDNKVMNLFVLEQKDKPAVFKNVPPGRYRISCSSFYRSPVQKSVSVGKSDVTITFCIDSLSGYRPNQLEGLKENDSLMVFYRSEGDFHGIWEVLVINKRGGELLARLYKKTLESTVDSLGNPGEILSHDVLIATKVMKKKEIAGFDRFKNEVGEITKGGGCTKVDSYEIFYLKRNYEFIDKTCEWNGWNYLVKAVFDID